MSYATEVMLVTPQLAELWLSRNKGNRDVRAWWVKDLIRIIKSGEWRLTHQGIAFDSDGNLIDGQHRLLAISQAGVPVEVMVTSGFTIASPLDFPVDLQARRSHSDTLRIPKIVAETASYIWRVASGHPPTTRDVDSVMRVYGETIRELIHSCASVRRTKSSAPVRAAVVIHAQKGSGSKLFSQYRHFVMMEYEAMTPSVVGLTKQIDGVRQIKTAPELFAKAYLAFDPLRLERTRVVLKDQEQIIADARAVIGKEMGIE